MARGLRAYGGQVGGGIFALRRPRPYSRHCGAYCHRPSYTPHGHQRAWREGEETTRYAASLRPPRNGRIGFKPPYSQRGILPLRTAGHRYARGGYKGRGGLCSDVACCVAPKKKRPPRRPLRMARGPHAYGGQVGGGIFALRRPRPYSLHCGAYCHRPPYTPHGHQRAWREGEETTRHAASLRPPRNGRIGFKPPYSPKGNPAPTDGWA